MVEETASRRRIPILTSFAAVLVAVGAKLSLTKDELLPGLDGAFYWVQVRSLLNHGTLAFPDLPLVFWVQAAVAKIVGDVQLGVRISDAVLPALSAIPIYFIAKHFKNPLLPAIAILVVLLNPIQLYFFTGDFIKNEAAIPVVFFIALVLFNWDSRSKRFSIITLVSLLIIVGLSHFGTALLAFSLVSLWGFLYLRNRGKTFWIKGLGILTAAFVVLLTALSIIVPSRYERLINLLTNPSSLVKNSVLNSFLQDYSDPIIVFTIAFTQLAVIILGLIAWLMRDKLTKSRNSLITSALLNAFFLSSPFISMEWAYRLIALSFAPLAIAAILIFGSSDFSYHKAPIVLLAGVTVFASIAFTSYEMKVVFSDDKYSEFKQLVEKTDIPSNSVIVARHGVHYLCAWHFETDVAVEYYYETADLSTYSAVFILEENRSSFDNQEKSNSELQNKDKTSKKTPLMKGKKSKDSDDAVRLNPSDGESRNESFILTRIR